MQYLLLEQISVLTDVERILADLIVSLGDVPIPHLHLEVLRLLVLLVEGQHDGELPPPVERAHVPAPPVRVRLQRPLTILATQEQVIAQLRLVHENSHVLGLPNYNSHFKLLFRWQAYVILGYLLSDPWLKYIDPALDDPLSVGKCGPE